MGKTLTAFGAVWTVTAIYASAWLGHIGHWACYPTILMAIFGIIFAIFGVALAMAEWECD